MTLTIRCALTGAIARVTITSSTAGVSCSGTRSGLVHVLGRRQSGCHRSVGAVKELVVLRDCLALQLQSFLYHGQLGEDVVSDGCREPRIDRHVRRS
jgi:hypothetical protein